MKTSPNGIPHIDGIFSSYAHELTEIVTNPTDNGWFAEDGENADKCMFHYYGAKQLENGSWWNTEWNGKKWYLEANWKVDNSGCAMKG